MDIHAVCMAIATLLTEPSPQPVITYLELHFSSAIPLFSLQIPDQAFLLYFILLPPPTLLFLSHFPSSSQSNWRSCCILTP